MKGFKSHFVFNRSQRNGIFLLVFIIVFLQVGYFFIDFSSEGPISDEQQELISQFQQQIDSLKKQASVKDSTEIFPFNPNFISDYKGYTLGMSTEEIDKLHAFRAQDKWINTKVDFQEVTGVSDSLLNKISPFFTFPEWVQNQRTNRGSGRKPSAPAVKQDLNIATAEALRQVNGVGEVLSQRIVNYRQKLKGFNDETQLYDVYGLSPEVVERIFLRFSVKEPAVEKKDINSISLVDLAEVPYFNYELAREVIRYRDSKGKIASFDELLGLRGFLPDKITRIKLYLAIN